MDIICFQLKHHNNLILIRKTRNVFFHGRNKNLQQIRKFSTVAFLDTLNSYAISGLRRDELFLFTCFLGEMIAVFYQI